MGVLEQWRLQPRSGSCRDEQDSPRRNWSAFGGQKHRGNEHDGGCVPRKIAHGFHEPQSPGLPGAVNRRMAEWVCEGEHRALSGGGRWGARSWDSTPKLGPIGESAKVDLPGPAAAAFAKRPWTGGVMSAVTG
jgi:hypothetical protein